MQRRNFLKGAGILSASSLLAFSSLEAFSKEKLKKGVKRSLRIGHLTDIHLLDKSEPKAAVIKVLRELAQHTDRPDLLINTGDSLMDMNRQPKDRVQQLWSAWDEVMQHNVIPMKSCIGNHDVWSLAKSDPQYEVAQKDELYGKAWIKKKLGLPGTYYTFAQKDWQFIALDSIHYSAEKGGYMIDPEQMLWLEQQLKDIPKERPILIFSHVPIISVTPLLYAAQSKPANELRFPGGDQHIDVMAIKSLFKKAGNVKVALSGHVHYVDQVSYLGTQYYCGGAVSGNWWNGILDDFPPAYSLLDLYEDGSSHYQTIYY